MVTKITKRQDAFITEYTKSGNATQAAIVAGYSPTSARVTGHRLITNDALQQRLTVLGVIGLNTLAYIALNGKNEIARVNASIALADRAFGKPSRHNGEKTKITVNFNKL